MNITDALAHATETRAFELGSAILESVPEILSRLGLGSLYVLVTDENTHAAAGKRLEGILRANGLELKGTICYPATPVLHPEYRHIVDLRAEIEHSHAVPIAVGSGTINDLVKRSAWECGRRYVSVGTAVSMDGYTSAGAAILKDGFKQTLECSAPIAVVGDLDVLSAAPPRMTAAGYGDLFAKIVAGADWIVADELGVEPIEAIAWQMVQDDLRFWLSRPAECANGEPESIARLYTGLSVTGFAMQAIHKSRPASGAEHQLSHIWEMENLEQNGAPVSHGLKVAMGSLATCALYELLADFDIDALDIDARVAAWPSWEERKAEIVARSQSAPFAPQMIAQSERKFISRDALRERLHLVRERWHSMQERLARQLYPYSQMRDMLGKAGCPLRPEEINLTRERAAHTIVLAQMMRERYTIVDLAYELGMLDEWKDRIFSSEKYWR